MNTNSKSIRTAISQAIEQLANKDSYSQMIHTHSVNCQMPSTKRLRQVVSLCREIVFPGYFGDIDITPESVLFHSGVNIEKLADLISDEIYAGLCFTAEDDLDVETLKTKAEEITASFISQLPELRRLLKGDVVAMYNGDPAALSTSEVIFAYPAIKAISNYRIAHALHLLNVPIIPRVISEMAHSETGIDIHPEASIGEQFAIDHGTGVVIGATCIIGNNVKLYQGVTLGAKSFPLDEEGNPIKGIPRHPIIEDNVIIYAQATILGRVTIGHDTTIGGNVWITKDVPPHSVYTQKNEK
ncbi:MAG: serine acetyltransferase [Bacteroidales bacterium]|nr:serine acetyltransferase [Bacteroidales bacterium]